MSKHAYVTAYPQEIWDKIVQLMRVANHTILEIAVAEEFGISEDSVRHWAQRDERGPGRLQDNAQRRVGGGDPLVARQ